MNIKITTTSSFHQNENSHTNISANISTNINLITKSPYQTNKVDKLIMTTIMACF